MGCSINKNFSFDINGTVQVQRNQYEYANHTLYEKNGDNYSPVRLPENLYTDVPREVEYHDTCEVTLDVDGAPFDRSVDRCSNMVDTLHNKVDKLTARMENLNSGIQDLTGGVGNLTTSTATAATGITAAKIASAETIASSLSRGFSKYIDYMIRERLMEVKAQIPSTASAFKALSDSLGKRKDVLGHDYERISDRYSKLFIKLNAELKRRLFELDRPAFEDCAQMQATIFSNPFGDIVGQSVCAGMEQLQAADAVRVSHLKETAETAMHVVKDYLKDVKKLSASVSNTLTEHKATPKKVFSMPVIRMECADIATPEKGTIRTFIPPLFESNSKMNIENVISDAFSKKETELKSQTELEIIDGCFKHHCSKWAAETEKGKSDPRITAKILKLWEQSKAVIFN